jgi:hypothetical protein
MYIILMESLLINGTSPANGGLNGKSSITIQFSGHGFNGFNNLGI